MPTPAHTKSQRMSVAPLPTPLRTLRGSSDILPKELDKDNDLKLTAWHTCGKFGEGKAMSMEERWGSALRAAAKQKALWDKIKEEWARHDIAKELALQFHLSFAEMKCCVQHLPGYGKQ